MRNLVCPICQKPFDPQKTVAMPFCSDRCRLVDLNRWLSEQHRLPSLPDAEEDLEPGDN